MKNTLLALLLVWSMPIFAQSIVTSNPKFEKRSTPNSILREVELTERYTILTMTFRNSPDASDRNARQRSILEDILGGMTGNGGMMQRRSSTATISINPNSFLADPKTGEKFKYIKAEGILESPRSERIGVGEVVEFRVYFQRVKPGVTYIDFFEGRDNDNLRYWNFYGVQIKNPLDPNDTAFNMKPIDVPNRTPDVEENPAVKEEAPVAKKSVMKGFVYDSQSNRPVEAIISYTAKTKNDSTKSNAYGAYAKELSPQLYDYTVTAKGYVSIKGSVDLSQADKHITRDIYLDPISEGSSLVLKNVNFSRGRADLLADSYEELDKWAALMKNTPSMVIRLEGHTDNVGMADKNQSLSYERVMEVRNYLIKKGIEGKRIHIKGHGGSKPVADNNTEEGRSQNRRVEVVVLHS